MNRSDLQRLSSARLREARILFRAGEYSGAYYLAGYAIECALKARFAKGVKRYDFPDRKGAGKIFTHKLGELVTLANLDAELLVAIQASSRFASGWELVCKWTEEGRYSGWTRDDAEAILEAIAGRKDGVLPWIKRHW
jgi:HEPN domain-containing protein